MLQCGSCVLSAEADRAPFWQSAYSTSQLKQTPARHAHMQPARPAAARHVLCWQAAVCALRELLQWRKYAGLYEGCQLRAAEGELVHMKARLRALDAFERLGNWGQVQSPGQA